ncbi:sensor domain-containing diguanylate cyclase [Chitinimonas koreensis]|uniref:sensor domain-containing diguanylate cyclase n=1 Tax=Chitinimonas koreensis TaxID=356302 RepID=UPI001B7F8A37|nr:sensor domain-containing diguanylate cyclase [Chitinimonas koreensis]
MRKMFMERKQQELLMRAFTRAANAVMIADRQGRIVWVNQALCRLSGYDEAELLGQTPALLHSGEHEADFYRGLWDTILAGQPWQGELIERDKQGRRYTVSQLITPLFDDSGAITHFIAIQHDLSAQQGEREKMEHLAYHDSLTGLPNRLHFVDRLNRAIAAAARQGGMLAVMFLDLDRFKAVNDTLGHAIGDRLLVSVAERLTGAVRKSDLVARLGGDEFTVLVTDLANAADVDSVARQLVAAVGQPFAFDHHPVQTHASIGISLYPRDGDCAELLLERADEAMYRVKAQGGGGYGHWQPALPR